MNYLYLNEKHKIVFTLEYIDAFKNAFDAFIEDNKYYECNKSKFIDHINNMIKYTNDKSIIKCGETLIFYIKSFEYTNNISNFKKLLLDMELLSEIILNLLNLELYFNRDPLVYNHKSNLINFHKCILYIINNIKTLSDLYDKIHNNYLEKLKWYSFYVIKKYDIESIDNFIQNIDNIHNQILELNKNLDIYEYYSTRKDSTLEFWNSVKKEFFELSYHPNLFKKIVLDEKDVCLFT